MAQLVFNVPGRDYGVCDLFAQYLPIAFAQAMERLLDRVLGHPQFSGNLRLRTAVRFASEQRLQAFEQNHVASGLKLLSKPAQNLAQQS